MNLEEDDQKFKKGSEFEIKADMVIKALGFDPEDLPKLFEAQELQVTKWGTKKLILILWKRI